MALRNLEKTLTFYPMREEQDRISEGLNTRDEEPRFQFDAPKEQKKGLMQNCSPAKSAK